MIQASVRIVAPAEMRDEILGVLHCLTGPTEVSSGCRGCRILLDADDPAAVMYCVQWDTREGLEEHFRTERFRRLLPYIEMSAVPPEVDISQMESLGGIELVVAAIGSMSCEGDGGL